MQHINGENRNQMFMISLESTISPEAFVRVIDAFVDAVDLKSFGFKHVDCNEEGRPAYHPSVLMKLYIYGYKYGLRSSRQLEREARLNMEAMWLLSGVHPKYHTIADFRKDNKKAFREIFRKFVILLKEWELIEGQTIAIDSFKIRAQNSLKNNFNEKKIKRHIAYIDEKIASYEAMLDQGDSEEDKAELEEKLEYQEKKKADYQAIQKKLTASGEEQVSLTDPDAKAVILHRNVVNVGYNVQASVDAKNKLLVEFETGDVNDTHALGAMAVSSKELLKVDHVNVIADKGYHTGEEIQVCGQNNITTYVSPRASSTNNKNLYPVEQFIYNKEGDTYTCPVGSTLRTKGRWYSHSDRKKGHSSYKFRRYVTTDCRKCGKKQQCTGGKHGRAIDRSEYAETLEANTKRVEENPDYYRQRQQIIEHVFGTLERQRGFRYTLVKGKDKVLGEVGLMFIGYNLSRCATIMGIKGFVKALRGACLLIKWLKNRLISSNFEALFLYKGKIAFS